MPDSMLLDILQRSAAHQIIGQKPGLDRWILIDPVPFPFLAIVGQAEMKLALILAVINGIVSYQNTDQDPDKNMQQAAVDFCRRSLMNGKQK